MIDLRVDSTLNAGIGYMKTEDGGVIETMENTGLKTEKSWEESWDEQVEHESLLVRWGGVRDVGFGWRIWSFSDAAEPS